MLSHIPVSQWTRLNFHWCVTLSSCWVCWLWGPHTALSPILPVSRNLIFHQVKCLFSDAFSSAIVLTSFWNPSVEQCHLPEVLSQCTDSRPNLSDSAICIYKTSLTHHLCVVLTWCWAVAPVMVPPPGVTLTVAALSLACRLASPADGQCQHVNNLPLFQTQLKWWCMCYVNVCITRYKDMSVGINRKKV